VVLRILAPVLVVGAVLSACAPKLPQGIDEAALDEAVARAVGSPSTCVVVEKRSGGLVYRYGSHTTCARSLPACDAPGVTTIQTQLSAARTGKVRTASCDTAEEASRGVAWASGPLPVLADKPDRQLIYAVFMESGDALSGLETKRRLEAAFARVGL
jgi:hypothetical protein